MSLGNVTRQHEYFSSYGACQACGRGKSRRKSKDAKRSISFDGELQRIGLRYKTSLDLISRFQVKSLPISQRLVVIGFLTLSSRREKILSHQPGSQLVESVARSTIVIALRGRIISLVVERVGTR